MDETTLLLIDANSIIHRSFHALPPLSAKDGSPGNALYGMSSILLRLLRSEPPTHAAALFDRPEPTFRKEKYAEYKATRPPAPSELISQIIAAHKLFPAFGIPAFETPGFEADDLIATMTERFGSRPGLRTVILTGDRDTLQLVSGEKIVVRAFKKGVSDTLTYDEKTIREIYGLSPGQLLDYKALVGDQSDNVKGVPGIGPKTAAALLQKYGDLESILADAEKEPKLQARVGAFKEQALFARMLVTLRRDAPMPEVSLEQLRFRLDTERLGAYFESLGFASLSKRMTGEDKKEIKKDPAKRKAPSRQKPMF